LLIADDEEQPRLLGVDLLTLQLQRALGAGATHGVILTKRSSAALVSTLETLRALGMAVDLARDPRQAADYIHPDEHVLILPDMLTIAPGPLDRLAASPPPTILCVEDRADNAHYELIDATARWSGAAVVPGDLVRRAAAIVGDWDFASVLLRNAIQMGAIRQFVTVAEQSDALLPIGTPDAAAFSGRKLLSQTMIENTGAGMAWFRAPIARWAARRVVGNVVWLDAGRVAQIGIGVCAFASLFALIGWMVASLALVVFGFIFLTIATLLGRAVTGLAPYRGWLPLVEQASFVAVIIGMGLTMTARTTQWGCLVLAVETLVSLWLMAAFIAKTETMPRWRADPMACVMIGLIGILAGFPIFSLLAMALYTVASLAWTLRVVFYQSLVRS
jgi:hypothetical protein